MFYAILLVTRDVMLIINQWDSVKVGVSKLSLSYTPSFSFSFETMAFFNSPALLVLFELAPLPGAGWGCLSAISSVLERCCKGGLTSCSSSISGWGSLLSKRCRMAAPVLPEKHSEILYFVLYSKGHTYTETNVNYTPRVWFNKCDHFDTIVWLNEGSRYWVNTKWSEKMWFEEKIFFVVSFFEWIWYGY